MNIEPKEIPEQIWCRNSISCCCSQSNYDNHPEGKAEPTYIYRIPNDDNESWRRKHLHFHLCWELGIKEPFWDSGTDEELKALTINVLRMMHDEIRKLRRQCNGN